LTATNVYAKKPRAAEQAPLYVSRLNDYFAT
jgi:hypothetical protein